jgi:hypothetical protein
VKADWGPPSLPLQAHLLEAGIPLLCCDHKLDSVTHVVLEFPGSQGEKKWRAYQRLGGPSQYCAP